MLARSSFNAEVLDALKKKVAALQATMFAMLVVEEQGPSGSKLVGVVEVSLQVRGWVMLLQASSSATLHGDFK